MSGVLENIDMTAELKHFGRKGMKWGQKIFSGGGGSLSKISDDDLRAAVARLDLEKRYVSLLAEKNTREAKNSGFVKSLLVTIGKREVSRVAGGAASLLVEQALKKSSSELSDIATRITPKKQSTGFGSKPSTSSDKSTKTKDKTKSKKDKTKPPKRPPGSVDLGGGAYIKGNPKAE